MTCTRVSKGSDRRINSAEEQSDEPLAPDVLCQNAVRSRQDFADVFPTSRQDAEVSSSLCHQESRTDTVPRHIAHHHAKAIMKHREIIEVIAPRSLGRKRGSRYIKSGTIRGTLRK